jgi:hypothetical protein
MKKTCRMNKTVLTHFLRKIRHTHLSFLVVSIALIMSIGHVQVGHAQQLVDFQEFQSIPTNSALDWEFFTIGTDHYLVVANYSNGVTRNINSNLYQWDGTSFVQFQSLATNGARDWEFFTIDTDHYLVVANYHNGTTINIDSKLYQWDGTRFVPFQSLPTNGAIDWEFFTIGTEHYLVVANYNYYNNVGYNTDSKLYQWDGTNFVPFQSILTNGAYNWEFFTIGTDHYLVVANYRNDAIHNINSQLYQWDGTRFVPFQSILTNGGIDWKFFTIGTDHYLAVANNYNDATYTYNTDSQLYQWDGTRFVPFQSIPTNGAIDWEFFTIGTDHYLVVANNNNDATNNIDSQLYQWDGTRFVLFQSIPTNAATNWEFFTIDTDHYLAVANRSNDAAPKIYQAQINRNDGVCIAPLGIGGAGCYQYKTQTWCTANEGTWYLGLNCKADFPTTPLSITINSFSATRNGNDKVKIKLATGSETKTAILSVVRAPAILQNLQQIQEICQWDGVGTEVSGSVYSCQDENAPANVVYWPVEVENNGVTNSYLEFVTNVQ